LPAAFTLSTGPVLAWQTRYDPFGAAVTVTAPATDTLRFPGQYYQLEDGLAYNWHRSYDASLGRYTQPDPLGFVDGPSLYGYAGQSPLMMVDPWGRQAISVPVPGGMSLPALGGPVGICIAVIINVFTPTPLADAECPCVAPEDAAPLPPLLSTPTDQGGRKPPPAANDNKPRISPAPPPIVPRDRWKEYTEQPTRLPPPPPEKPWWVRLLEWLDDPDGI
jgi:RHS repeat-associated protein